MSYKAFQVLDNYTPQQLASIKAYGDKVIQSKSFDSSNMKDSMIFLISQIAAIDPVLYKRSYVDIKFQDLVPVQTYDEGAGEWVYFSVDGTTLGKFVAGNSTNLPTVSLEGAKHKVPFHTAGIQVSYHREEMRQMALIGRSVAQEKIEIAIRGCMEHMQSVAYEGDSEKGITGLFNNSNVAVIAAPSDITTDGTVARIFCQDLMSSVHKNSKGVEIPNTVLLPISVFDIMSNTPGVLGATALAETELSFFKKNNIYTQMTGQELKISVLPQLETAGASGQPRVIAYTNDSYKLAMGVSFMPRFIEPQPKGLGFDIPGEYKFGGVAVRYPGSMAYGDNA